MAATLARPEHGFINARGQFHPVAGAATPADGFPDAGRHADRTGTNVKLASCEKDGAVKAELCGQRTTKCFAIEADRSAPGLVKAGSNSFPTQQRGGLKYFVEGAAAMRDIATCFGTRL